MTDGARHARGAAPSQILVLGGRPLAAQLEADAGRIVRHADSPMGAAEALAVARPDVIVIEAGVDWQSHLVDRIPGATRPAVVAFGDGRLRGAVTDEWIRSPAAADELEARLRLGWERARERRRKSRQGLTDALTGLPNRRALIAALVFELHRSRRQGTGVALALLDLDDFQRINERAGHNAGDRFLRRAGRLLSASVRADELCGRLGGDEFALVLAGDAEGAQRAADRLAGVLRPIGISATTGSGALLPGEQLRGLYRRVDAMLRRGKRSRRASLQAQAEARQPNPAAEALLRAV